MEGFLERYHWDTDEYTNNTAPDADEPGVTAWCALMVLRHQAHTYRCQRPHKMSSGQVEEVNTDAWIRSAMLAPCSATSRVR